MDNDQLTFHCNTTDCMRSLKHICPLCLNKFPNNWELLKHQYRKHTPEQCHAAGVDMINKINHKKFAKWRDYLLNETFEISSMEVEV